MEMIDRNVYRPNCWVRMRSGPQAGKWYKKYLAIGSLANAARCGKAMPIGVNAQGQRWPEPPECDRVDESLLPTDADSIPAGFVSVEDQARAAKAAALAAQRMAAEEAAAAEAEAEVEFDADEEPEDEAPKPVRKRRSTKAKA